MRPCFGSEPLRFEEEEEDGPFRIRLLVSTEDLQWEGRPLPGLPLFASSRVETDVIANFWIVWMATARGLSWKTAWAYAKSLKVFLENREHATPGRCWTLTSETDVVAFKMDRAMRVARDNEQHKRTDADTIALNLFGLSSFFGFAADKGFIQTRPFLVKRRPAAVEAFPGCTVVTAPRSTAKRIVVLRPEEFEAIRAKLPITGEVARQSADLIMLWAWGTGLRLFEACGLSRWNLVRSVLSAYRAAGGAVTDRMSLRVAFMATTEEAFIVDLLPEFTKGKRGGSIAVPRDLVKASIEYLDLHGRASMEEGAGLDPLFLNAKSTRVNPSTIGRQYRAAVAAAGLNHDFHSIRHTYATRTLSLFQAAGKEVIGLLFLKSQLRHRCLETTRRYLHVLQMHAHESAAHMVVNAHFQSRTMA